MAEHRRVVLAVELDRPGPARPNEALPVQAQLAPAAKRCERLRRKVVAREGARMNPVGLPERPPTQPRASSADQGSPGSSSSRLRRLPSSFSIRNEIVRAAGPGHDRDAERMQAAAGVLRSKLGDENGGVSQEHAQSPRRIEGRAAQPRHTAVNAIQRNEPDDAQEAHVRTVRPRRERTRARTTAATPHP